MPQLLVNISSQSFQKYHQTNPKCEAVFHIKRPYVMGRQGDSPLPGNSDLVTTNPGVEVAPSCNIPCVDGLLCK